MDYYAHNCGANPASGRKERRQIIFPKRFSLIEGPDEALEVLGKLARFSYARRTHKIYIDQGDCELIDLGAESAASVLALEAQRKAKVAFQGRFPESREPRDIVLAAGLPHNLAVPGHEEPEGFLKFELTQGRKLQERAFRSSPRERITTDLTQYVDTCLRVYGFRLTPDAADWLASLVGEVIGNAEDHCERPYWWAAAYLRRRRDSAYGDCHVTIFNFGLTLFQSLQRLPKNARLRREIERLVAEHRKRGFFKPNWTTENLWTLYALQEGVSRFNADVQTIGDRGQGTADMIHFFQLLGQSKKAPSTPKMCLVSGRTWILFDGQFKMAERAVSSSGRPARIIAFNAGNDLGQPPSAQHVKNLRKPFPGTMISLRFYLDKDYLTQLGG